MAEVAIPIAVLGAMYIISNKSGNKKENYQNINTMLPKQDLEYMLRDSQAKAVICSKDLLEVFIEIKNSFDNEILIISEEAEKVTTNNDKIAKAVKIKLNHSMIKNQNNRFKIWGKTS